MTKQEFNSKQNEVLHELGLSPTPTTQSEKDIRNLKYLRYSITAGSKAYRLGCIASLDRAIAKLKDDSSEESQRDYIVSLYENFHEDMGF